MAMPSSTREGDPPLGTSQRPPSSAGDLQAWQRLQAAITSAADELRQLRQENADLKARVAELESRSTGPPGRLLPGAEDDPAQLRRTIDSFIETIDSYLERNR